jgi:hypothetical protein
MAYNVLVQACCRSINVWASLPLTNVDGEIHRINTQHSQGDCAILGLSKVLGWTAEIVGLFVKDPEKVHFLFTKTLAWLGLWFSWPVENCD